MNTLTWWGCFANDVDKSLVTAESVLHPAKMAPLLTTRIYQHLADHYGLKPGDRIADPFGGIGMTGLIGARLGYTVTVIELERFFYQCIVGHRCTADDLCPRCQIEREQEQPSLFAMCDHYYPGNLDILERHRGQMGYTGKLWAIQGDSRQMVSLLKKYIHSRWQPRAILTSPPYADSVAGRGDGPGQRYDHLTHTKKTATKKTSFNGYGDEPGQIGKLAGAEYWQMMGQVYDQCYQALKPGQPLAVAIKPIIKNKKIIDLPQLTIDCLKDIGFEVPEMAKAMVIEPEVQLSMLDRVDDRQKAHESMWRRKYRKDGLAIDYEAVIFAVRP